MKLFIAVGISVTNFLLLTALFFIFWFLVRPITNKDPDNDKPIIVGNSSIVLITQSRITKVDPKEHWEVTNATYSLPTQNPVIIQHGSSVITGSNIITFTSKNVNFNLGETLIVRVVNDMDFDATYEYLNQDVLNNKIYITLDAIYNSGQFLNININFKNASEDVQLLLLTPDNVLDEKNVLMIGNKNQGIITYQAFIGQRYVVRYVVGGVPAADVSSVLTLETLNIRSIDINDGTGTPLITTSS